MLDQIVVIYCICDEVAKTFNIKDDDQCKMSTAEVMTFAVISAMLFGCDYKKTRTIAFCHKYFSNILSHSRLVRRIHQVPDVVWLMLFTAIQILLRDKNNTSFIVDSFPVKAYENHKRFRARIFTQKDFHGYIASKDMYFFGIKVHMVVDTNGVPIEFVFTPGNASDIKSLEQFDLDLPNGSVIMGDKAYTSYALEEVLEEFEGIKLLAKRAKHHKRIHTLDENHLLHYKRNFIETVFSCIISRMPRQIKARTEKGFCLKIVFFIIAYMIHLFFPLS